MRSTKLGIFGVRAQTYHAALAKAKTKVGKNRVVGDVRMVAKHSHKGMKNWQVVAHKRKK